MKNYLAGKWKKSQWFRFISILLGLGLIALFYIAPPVIVANINFTDWWIVGNLLFPIIIGVLIFIWQIAYTFGEYNTHDL